MIEAILYCEFDNAKGSMIMFQYPRMKISNDLFDTYSEFVITKTKLCGKCVSFRHENLIFIGVPQCIEGPKYERNALLFNLVFVVDITKLKHHYPPEAFKPIASKLSYYLRNLELESEYLFKQESKQNLQYILERIYVDLSTKQECSIGIDSAHSLHLKLIPYLHKPPLVHAHDVPIPIRNLHNLIVQQKDTWDITFSQIIPHIDGISFVKQIAIQSNVHVEIVKKSLQHLLYFQCIKLIDIFQYSNMYALKNKKVMMQLFSRRDLEEEMIHYICPGVDKSNMPDSSQILHHILQIYCKFKPGLRLQEIMEKHHHLCQYINPKCLITYGLLKGFIKRVHEYPFLLKDEPPTLVSSNDEMSSSQSSDNLEQIGSPMSGSFDSSPSKTFTVITKQKKLNPNFHIVDRETLRPYITGKYSIDEICCELEVTRSELMKSLEQFENVQILFR